MEPDKKLRREIANSNERRRMQSINSGFQSLRTLLPHHEGEKLSKAAILQQTAEYIYSLEQEKTRLLAQNCQLKRLLSLSQQQNAENEDQMQDQGMPLSPLASRRKKAKMAEKASAAPSSSSSEDMKQQTVICDQPQQTTVVATPAIVPQPPPPQATQQVTVKPEQLLPTQPAPIIAGTNSATLPGGITITKQELPSKLQPTQQQPTPSISVTAQPIIHGTPSVTLTGGPSSAAAANAVAARLLKQQTPVTFLPNQPVPNRPPAAVIVTANAMTSVRGPLKQETDDIKPPTLPPTLQLPTQPSPAVKVLATGGVGSSHLPVNLATLITKAKVPAAHQPTTIAPVISNPPATVVLRPPQPPPQSVAVVTSVKQPATVALSTNPHIQVKTTTDTGSAGGPSNLDSIVAAIRHLEGDHLFSDSSNAQAKPENLALKRASPGSVTVTTSSGAGLSVAAVTAAAAKAAKNNPTAVPLQSTNQAASNLVILKK